MRHAAHDGYFAEIQSSVMKAACSSFGSTGFGFFGSRAATLLLAFEMASDAIGGAGFVF